MNKKRILIIGPIVDFGGREVMTNLLVSMLSDVFEVKVLSTVSMSKSSVAIKGMSQKHWDTIGRAIFNRNLFIKLTAQFTKLFYKKQEPAYFFIKNKFTKPFFDFEKRKIKVIHRFVNHSDLIIYSDEIHGKWLKRLLQIINTENKSLLLRLTGQIKTIPSFLIDSKGSINLLAHSKQNADATKSVLNATVWNIEQTSAIEKDLLKLEISENKPLVYAFLGRFSPEKGIVELLSTFTKNQNKILIAGSGPLLEEVLVASNKNKTITYQGELKPNQIAPFFDEIDVLIIPSFEEGGPIVGIETMAAGKLIISTKVGAMPERLEGTGSDFWFSHKDDNSLQTSINSLEKLTQQERLKIRQKVRQKYVLHNSFNFIKAQYLELIKSIFNQSK